MEPTASSREYPQQSPYKSAACKSACQTGGMQKFPIRSIKSGNPYIYAVSAASRIRFIRCPHVYIKPGKQPSSKIKARKRPTASESARPPQSNDNCRVDIPKTIANARHRYLTLVGVNKKNTSLFGTRRGKVNSIFFLFYFQNVFSACDLWIFERPRYR